MTLESKEHLGKICILHPRLYWYRWSWFKTGSDICSVDRYKKLHSEELNINLWLSNKNFSLCTVYWYTGRVWTSRLWLLSLWHVCYTEGFSLLLVKGCDRIATVTLCEQKHPLKVWAYINWTAVYAWLGCGCEASPSWVLRQFLAETYASKLKGKIGPIIKRCFDKTFLQCWTQHI